MKVELLIGAHVLVIIDTARGIVHKIAIWDSSSTTNRELDIDCRCIPIFP
jgi:hypothetical protein